MPGRMSIHLFQSDSEVSDFFSHRSRRGSVTGDCLGHALSVSVVMINLATGGITYVD